MIEFQSATNFKNYALLLTILLITSMLITLGIINKPCVIATFGQTMLINSQDQEINNYYSYVININNNQFSKLNLKTLNIFLTITKTNIKLFHLKWLNNQQLIIADHINIDKYPNQTILLIYSHESLLKFIWNNIMV